MVSEKVMTDLYVLCLRVLNRIVSNLVGTLIVAVEGNLIHFDAIVLDSLLHPKKLKRSKIQQQFIQIQQWIVTHSSASLKTNRQEIVQESDM